MLVTKDRGRSLTVEAIKPWFEKVKLLFDAHKYEPSLIYNLDETSMSSIPKPDIFVITTPELSHPTMPEPISSPSTSLLSLISADGSPMQQTMILPLASVPHEYAALNSPQLSVIANSSGYINNTTFSVLFRTNIVPQIIKRRQTTHDPTTHAVLFMDGLVAHAQPGLLKLAKDNLIDIVFFPSYTSSHLQPLDLYVNANLKLSLSEFLPAVQPSTQAEKRVLFAQSLRQALHRAFSPPTILSSFRDAGLWPFNPEIVLKNLPARSPSRFTTLSPPNDERVYPWCGQIYPASDDLTDLFLPPHH